MARKNQLRHKLSLFRETSERLAALVAKAGVSQSSLAAEEGR